MTSCSFHLQSSLTRLEDEKCESSSSRVVSWYHLLTSHGIWINTCDFRRLCEPFWFHSLLIKHQVDVVPGERQRFVVVDFQSAQQNSVSICLLCQHQSVLMMTWSQSWEKKVKHWEKWSEEPSTNINVFFSPRNDTIFQERIHASRLRVQTLFS